MARVERRGDAPARDQRRDPGRVEERGVAEVDDHGRSSCLEHVVDRAEERLGAPSHQLPVDGDDVAARVRHVIFEPHYAHPSENPGERRVGCSWPRLLRSRPASVRRRTVSFVTTDATPSRGRPRAPVSAVPFRARMNRSALTLIALAVALLAAGCGSNKTSGNATDDALSFVPKQAPIVVSINTDPNGGQWKNVDKLLSKFPGSGAIKAQLKQSISSSSGGKLDYDRDVKPILGNDLVVSAPSTAAARVNQYAVAVKPRDLGKAQQLVGRYPK